MKRFYVDAGIIRYSVCVKKLETNSNYNHAISIKMVGERFPTWGTTVKETDNFREIASNVIKTWSSKTN